MGARSNQEEILKYKEAKFLKMFSSRFDGTKIDYMTHFDILVRLKVNFASMVSYSNSGCKIKHEIEFGIMGILGKKSAHCNGIKINHKLLMIERFEPYGNRKNKEKKDATIDKLLTEIVSKMYGQSYTCRRYFDFNFLGPQSRDPPKTGFCYAWSLCYIMQDQDQKDQDFNRLDFKFIVDFSKRLYENFPRLVSDKEMTMRIKYMVHIPDLKYRSKIKNEEKIPGSASDSQVQTPKT